MIDLWPGRLRRKTISLSSTRHGRATIASQRRLLRTVAMLLMASMLALACGGATDSATSSAASDAADSGDAGSSSEDDLSEASGESADTPADDGGDEFDLDDAAPDPEPEPSATSTPEPVAFGTPLPKAQVGIDSLAGTADAGPQPVSIMIDDLGISDAPVVPVGVNEDETFEVPEAEEVGWYRFGPSPGLEGSSVLAAHIAYDGVDGVFRSLADVEPGAEVVVGFDDGSSERFRIVSVTDYFKEDLPDSLFARDGDPQLALITCGGGFQPELRSYDSNTVAIAIPIAA